MGSGYSLYWVFLGKKNPTIWQNQNNFTVKGYGEYLRDDPAVLPLTCKHNALNVKNVSTLRWSLYVSFVVRACCQGSVVLLLETRFGIQFNVHHFHSSQWIFLPFIALSPAHHRISGAWFNYKLPNIFSFPFSGLEI